MLKEKIRVMVLTVQPQPRVQPVAHTDPADPGAECQVEGVADKRHQHDLAFRQLVPAIGPTEQIVAAVNEVADDNQRNGAKQGQPIVAADHLPHVLPVDFLRVDHQQDDDGDKKEHGQHSFRHPPAGM